MKQLLLTLALALAAALPMSGQWTTTSEMPKRMHGAQQRVTAAIPATTAKAWMVRDRASLPLGLVSFSVDHPETFTSLHALPDKAFAGVNTPDGYYFYRFHDDTAAQEMVPLAWSKVDPSTGTITDIADWSQRPFIFNDMAYDYATNTIYALAREIYVDDFLTALQFEYSALYRVDATTGVATRLKQFINWNSGAMNNPTYITLTADLEGNLYAIDSYGYLVRLDRDNDWEEIVVGDTGRRPAMRLQSMDYDPVSGKIFWAADYQNALADLCMIDPATGATYVTGTLGNDARVAGMAIDYVIPSAGAPSGVSSLTATPDAAGAEEATIAFTLPTRTFANSGLGSISSVALKRDGQSVKTWTSQQPGATLSHTDTQTGAGWRTYTVTAANALGAGLTRSVTIWTGHDVPDAPTGAGVGRNDDGSAIVVWEAPTQGLHGGWIDTQNMKYDITRVPDNTLVAVNLEATTFTDRTIPSMGSYGYIVTPHTSDGIGAQASTPVIELGDFISQYPYNCLFENQSVFDTWTVLNPNGGSTWQWKRRGLADYDCFAMYQYDNNNDADDYLVSPGMLLKPGATYQLRFNYRGSNASHTEKFDIRFGNAPTTEALTESLRDYTVRDGDSHFDTLTIPAVQEEGIYYIAFHATSEKKMYNIYITDVTVTMTGGGQSEPEPEVIKPVTDLNVYVDTDNGNVTLSWSHDHGATSGDDGTEGISTPIREDWENYADWALNPSGTIPWSYVDGDMGIPYRSDYADMPYPTDGAPLAAMIMAPYQLSADVYDPNPPHGGEKYLLFKSNFSAGDGSRPAPRPDDYLISPKLNYSSDFVFSFWCKADPDLESQASGFFGSELWNHEEFRVGYSLTGKDVDDFIWIGGDTLDSVTSMGSSWVKKEYSIPADAKYVAINYCTRENGFWFMVDDIYIGTPQAAPALREQSQAPVFQHFDVYMDNVFVASTPATSHIITGLEEGLHKARVVAVYDQGESEGTELEFLLHLVGVNDTAVTTMRAWHNTGDDCIRFSSLADRAALYDMSGRCVAAASHTDRLGIVDVVDGIYLLRLTVGNASYTQRIILK